MCIFDVFITMYETAKLFSRLGMPFLLLSGIHMSLLLHILVSTFLKTIPIGVY